MKVVYIVNASSTKVTKTFESAYLCRQFVNKLKRSKKCTLVSYPLFS